MGTLPLRQSITQGKEEPHLCPQQGLSPMLMFSQMVLKRSEMFRPLHDLLASEGMWMSLPLQDENSLFHFFYFAFTVPSLGAGLSGGSKRVLFHSKPLLKEFQVRRGLAAGSHALVLGSSAETFPFPGADWCCVRLGLKPPLRPSNCRDRLQPPPAHDSRSPWGSVHRSL